jgi:exo-1,4-beta-D-glucosaminidase
LSRPGYDAAGFCAGASSSTVFGDLVRDGQYPDPFFSDRLREYFGEVPEDSLLAPPFQVPWWYRTEHTLPALTGGQHVLIDFDGISYGATLWVNGSRVGDMLGTHRTFRFDITSVVQEGPNAIALLISAPGDPRRDQTIYWNDENRPPPDGGMGIRRDVRFTITGPVALEHPWVTSRLDLPSLDVAHLSVGVQARNPGPDPVSSHIEATLADRTLARDVVIAPGTVENVAFDPLDLSSPRIWWPRELGDQPLYEVRLSADVNGVRSDEQMTSFGIREVTASITGDGYRSYAVNGQHLFVRGAAWNGDLLNGSSPSRLSDEIDYARDLGLNTIRIEGHFEPDSFYGMLDRAGLLLLAGWNCCDGWQTWTSWTETERTIARESMRDVARRLRSHPSVLDFLLGSDEAPPDDIIEMYANVLREESWPNPIGASARETVSASLGPNGMTQGYPYGWVPPSYYYQGRSRRGAVGFNTELGPGPDVPGLASLHKMMTNFDLVDLASGTRGPLYHAGWSNHGLGTFAKLDVFHEALEARLGPAVSISDYIEKAQILSYEGHRALFESFARNRNRGSTGLIFWMLNSAWPSLIWHAYDYYLSPGASYFGIKKANERLHAQYSYDDRSVVVSNAGRDPVSALVVRSVVYDAAGRETLRREQSIDVPADDAAAAFAVSSPSSPFVLDLTVEEASGVVRSRGCYALSATDESVDWSRETFADIPATSYADLTALLGLPFATVAATQTTEVAGDDLSVAVTLENTSDTLAFFVELRLGRADDGTEVVPVRWDDNYVCLAPHERRTIAATVRAAALSGQTPVVAIRGVNVALGTVK